MNEAQVTPPMLQRRAPRWLWIGFFISLMLNLIVLGIAIGAAWHFHANKNFRASGAPRQFSAFLRRLPSERRNEFRDMLSNLRPALSSLRNEVRAARQKAEAVMIKEPFDRDEFATENLKLHEARVKLRARRAKIFVQIVEAMTVEERQLFIQWRHKRWRRWRQNEQ